MNLKNIPIGSKILSLVIVALLGMAFIGFNGYRGLSNASDDIDNMYSRKLQATKLLGNEINYMRMVQVRIVKHVLDPKDAKVKASIHDAMDSFEKEWPAYRDLGARVPETANDIAQAEANWKKYKEGVLEAERLADKGETQAAWNYYQGVEAGVTQDLLKNLTALQKIANDNADKLNEEVSSSMSSNLWFMTVVTLVCLTLLGLMSFFIIREIITSIRQMIDNCRNMGEGDFRHKPLLGRGDELGEMDAALHEMRTKMNKLMREVHDSAQQLAAASEELTASSGQAAQVSTQVAQSATDVVGSVEKQERSVANTNNAVESLQASMEGIRQESARVAERSGAASNHATVGSTAIDGSVAQMKEVESTVLGTAKLVDRLGNRSKEIGEIVDTISSIAEQTNLLALNASIEAARAGEQGRGFNVVAGEVAKLASESQESAKKIAELIAAIQEDTSAAVASMDAGREAVKAGVDSVEGLRATFEDINCLVQEVSDEIQAVSGSITKMTRETETITEDISQISSASTQVSGEMQAVSAATEQQSASAQEIAAASDALAVLAQKQQASLAGFSF